MVDPLTSDPRAAGSNPSGRANQRCRLAGDSRFSGPVAYRGFTVVADHC